MDAWKFFKIYHSFKLHFTDPRYDVLKYGIRTSVTFEKFCIRPDKDRFIYISNKVQREEDAGLLCIANFTRNNSDFMYDRDSDPFRVLDIWKSDQNKIPRLFSEEFKNLQKLATTKGIKFKSMFDLTPNGNNPPLFQLYTAGKISNETLLILDDIYGFLIQWNIILSENPLWNNRSLMLEKYRPFFKYKISEVKEGFK